MLCGYVHSLYIDTVSAWGWLSQMGFRILALIQAGLIQYTDIYTESWWDIMYDNDPQTHSPLNVEIYCFNFPEQCLPTLGQTQTRARLGPGSWATSLIASHFAPGKTKIFSLSEFAGFIIKIYPGPLNNLEIIRSCPGPPRWKTKYVTKPILVVHFGSQRWFAMWGHHLSNYHWWWWG